MKTKMWWEYLFPNRAPEPLTPPKVTVGEPIKNIRRDGKWDYRPLGQREKALVTLVGKSTDMID